MQPILQQSQRIDWSTAQNYLIFYYTSRLETRIRHNEDKVSTHVHTMKFSNLSGRCMLHQTKVPSLLYDAR
jgi:hypothetical protein